MLSIAGGAGCSAGGRTWLGTVRNSRRTYCPVPPRTNQHLDQRCPSYDFAVCYTALDALAGIAAVSQARR